MTVLGYLRQLPDGIRERAIENCKDYNGKAQADNIQQALLYCFAWGKTPEGFDFWCTVREHYIHNTPLPKEPTK